MVPLNNFLIDPAKFRSLFEAYANKELRLDKFAAYAEYEPHALLDEILYFFNGFRHRKFLVLAGGLGCGKTHIFKTAKRIYAEFNVREMQFKIVQSELLVKKAKDSGLAAFSDLFKCGLTINDFGKNDGPINYFGDHYNPIDALVYHRFERYQVTTNFTTNYADEDVFLEQFDPRTADRIRANIAWFDLSGKNYRHKIQKT